MNLSVLHVITISFMIEQSFITPLLREKRSFLQGLERGVAIPHAKLDVLNDFHFCIGIQLESGLEWNSLDGNPVRIVFLILGPSSDQRTYLQLLSEITAMVKNEEFSFEIFKGKTPFELAQLFQQLEKK